MKKTVTPDAWSKFPVKLIFFIAFGSASSACGSIPIILWQFLK